MAGIKERGRTVGNQQPVRFMPGGRPGETKFGTGKPGAAKARHNGASSSFDKHARSDERPESAQFRRDS